MAEEKNRSAAEPLQKSAQAASAVRSAVKTGKAIAGTAKGAAAGGPYGAAAGAVWGNRKVIGKIIIVVVALLMIPILFICMLPALIFGGLLNAFSPDKPNTPILNDSEAVSANLSQIVSSVDTVLSESMSDLLDQIDEDFRSSDADQKEIINPYETPSYNTNQLIGLYCAYRNEDFAAVSVSDMEDTLRQNKDKLYSYTKTTEERTTVKTTVSVDPITGQEVETTTTVTETWAVYTIVYNGEDYFADEVFYLTDDQKALAADYAQNLTLFLEESETG